MELISTALAALGTAAGKAAAGAVVAAASVAGLDAADVIDVPLLPEDAQTTVVETLPADGETVSSTASEGRSDEEAELEEAEVTGTLEEEGAEEEGAEEEGAEEEGDPNENADFGQGVAADARGEDGTPGVDGKSIAGMAQENRPERPEQSQAPADAGSQADKAPGSQAPEAAPEDDAAETAEDDQDDTDVEDDEDDTEGEPPVETGPGARGNAPADAGSED